MKTPKKYDLCEVYFTEVNGKKITRWVSTPHRNLPYTITKFKMDILNQDKRYPKGTIFIPVENGKSPLDKLRDAKPKLEVNMVL